MHVRVSQYNFMCQLAVQWSLQDKCLHCVQGVEEGDIFIVSATAKHAATESTAQPHARALLQRKLKVICKTSGIAAV